MRQILDAGALLAVERGDRGVLGMLRVAHRAGHDVVTHGGVVGQVWRGGARQARLAAALRGIDIVPLDATLGRRVGVLLAATGTSDVVDAAVALLAQDGDEVVTSDPEDLTALLVVTGAHVEVRPV